MAYQSTRSTTAPTSLDTHATSGTTYEADPDWAVAARLATAAELGNAWPERRDAMGRCGQAGVTMTCGACGAPSVFPYRCGARTCPSCARRVAAAVADRADQRVAAHDLIMSTQGWDGVGRPQRRGWKMLTLTARMTVECRFDPDELRQQIRMLLANFRRFWRVTDWGRQKRDSRTHRKRSRRDTSYIRAIEVSPKGMVHLHVLVYGEFVPQRLLQSIWSDICGDLAIVDIRAVRGVRRALREVLKYATKGEKGPREQARHAAAVELAFRNVRRVEYGGALRGVRTPESSGGDDDGQPEDLHNYRVAACAVCGSVGDWRWAWTVDAATVQRNGGVRPPDHCPRWVSLWYSGKHCRNSAKNSGGDSDANSGTR